jgi:hypothetical protein
VRSRPAGSVFPWTIGSSHSSFNYSSTPDVFSLPFPHCLVRAGKGRVA